MEFRTGNKAIAAQAVQGGSGQAMAVAISISAAHFVHDVFSSFLPVVLPLLIEKIGLSLLAAGSFTLIFRLPTFWSPFIGRVADRKDLRVLAALAPAVTAIGMSLLGMASGYTSVCLLLFVAGISSVLMHVLGPVIIARSTPGQYGRGMGFWMLGGEASRALGPVFAAWSITVLGFEGLYPLMGFGIVFSLLLLVYLRRVDLPEALPSTSRTASSWKKLVVRMVPLSSVIIARAVMVGTLVTFLPTYLVSTGQSVWIGGLAFALMQFFGIFGTLLGGYACDRYGARPVLLIFFLLSGALQLSMVYAQGWILYPVLALLGCFIFTIAPVNMAVLQETFRDEKGAANGLYTTVNFAATALAAVVMGWVGDRWGLGSAFFLNGLVGIIAVPAVLLIRDRADAKRQPE